MSSIFKTFLVIISFVLVFAIALAGYRYYINKNEPFNITKNSKANKNPAIDFTVLDADENPVRLSDHFGKPIIINFWATWCSPCKAELPLFNETYRVYGDKIDFMMVSTNDTIKNVKSFIEENEYGFPVYYDTEGSGAKAYNVYSIPKTVIINSDGYILDTYTGIITDSKMNEYINALIY